jgi:membrane protein
VRDLIGFPRFVLRRWNEDRCPQVASSLAFTTLLALAPIFAIGVAVLSATPLFGDVMAQLRVVILANLAPEIADKVIHEFMPQIARNARKLTWLGVGVLLVTAVALVLTIDRTFNAIWHVKRRRSYWLTVATHLFLVLVGPLLIGMGVTVTTYLMTLAAGVGVTQYANPVLLHFVPVLFTSFTFFLLYRLIPHAHVPWRHAAIGGIVAGILFEAAKDLFAYYVRYGPTYNVLYGTFAALPFFLLWVYLSWLVVLLGAELTASMGHWKQPSGERMDA